MTALVVCTHCGHRWFLPYLAPGTTRFVCFVCAAWGPLRSVA